MKKNKKALSLIIAMGLALVMSLLALFILEYMIPFGKNTKNIEQSAAAYYQADSAIEDALLNDLNDTLVAKARDYGIDLTKTGTVLPPVGQGNSDLDSNYNIIRIGEPIQIEIGDASITPSDFKIYFRVPDIGSSSTLSGSKIVNWQLSGENDVLNSSGSQITVSEIDDTDISISFKNGLKLDDTGSTFSTFYSSQCGTNSGCILKMSVINKLELSDGTNIPYLEWKIETGNSNAIPLRYKIIDTTGKSYGFQKSLRVKIPQQTLNEAFDFTVFQ